MAKEKEGKGQTGGSAKAGGFVRNVVPDALDIRDRIYTPTVARAPEAMMKPWFVSPVLQQGDTNACTGFSLAAVVYHLYKAAKRSEKDARVSPFMLYSMARRYDEFPGNPDADTGSSLRGAMKGWYKHGACAAGLWKTVKMPPAATRADKDWWIEAVNRPLGAYYRIETRSVTDMHVALLETGVLYASAVCHSGWDEGSGKKAQPGSDWWIIPSQKAKPSDGGHAFAIVGYTKDGFIIQNSWGETWGTKGRAILTYDDWLTNAMDCWVAQLGVVTSLHREIATATSLRRSEAGTVQIAGETKLRNREISPFIIDMANNGLLSNTGEFRTRKEDVEALVTYQLDLARKAWGLGTKDPVDIAIYAHGGLTAEDTAAKTAAKWIPALYDARVFPIFLMWETDLWSTLKGRFEDLLSRQARPTGGVFDDLGKWWNGRLERLLSVPGAVIWGEMKQNAEAISTNKDGGGMMLYQACNANPLFQIKDRVRLHLIGHSAGSIVHCHIIKLLGGLGWKFASVNFMAPAATGALFADSALPAIRKGIVQKYAQYHLTDAMEQKDPTCKPIMGYSQSLLYLVSRSFEGGRDVPIVGMERFCTQIVQGSGPGKVEWHAAPGADTQSITHGGFDDDDATMASIIKGIVSFK